LDVGIMKNMSFDTLIELRIRVVGLVV
jgi:hypothetical protein